MTTGNSTWRTHAALLLCGVVLVLLGFVVSQDNVAGFLKVVGAIATIGGALNLFLDARDADKARSGDVQR